MSNFFYNIGILHLDRSPQSSFAKKEEVNVPTCFCGCGDDIVIDKLSMVG